MNLMTRLVPTATLVLLTLSPAFAQQAPPENVPPPQRPGRAQPQRSAPPEQVAYRVDATIYQVTLPAAKALELDRRSLAQKAATPAEFAAVLGQLGSARLLYRADQAVDMLRGATLEASLDVPYVTGRVQTPAGSTQSAIARQRNGVKMQIKGQWNDSDGGLALSGITADVELSVLAQSDVSIGDGLNSPCFAHVSQNYAGSLRPGTPIVLVSVENVSTTGDSATAFVTRLVIEPE